MRLFLALAIVLATPAVAEAKLHHEAVGYGEFEGYMAYDDANLKDLPAFQAELRAHHTNYELDLYGGAVHAFSNPDAGHDPAKGAAYDAQADQRSWRAMAAFFKELFGV
jgi:dienelactone hydrolase